MKGAWKIGEVLGIGIYVHFTFLLLVTWVAVSQYAVAGNLSAVWEALLFLFCLFTIIVLHELGHALAAKRFGIRTRDIVLLPIGGVARLERMPDNPWQELVVALAGPAVNVILALILYLFLSHYDPNWQLGHWSPVRGTFAGRLFGVNVVLALFNLLPAFPMDGGRVLRALLATQMDYVRATHWAAWVGQAMAILFGLAGLFTPNPMLLFIALFVWIGAAQEASMVELRWALGGIPVWRVMITEFHTLHPEDPLSKAGQYILAGYQHDFPVVDNGKVVGILTHTALLSGLSRLGETATVKEVMEQTFDTAEANEMVQMVFERLDPGSAPCIPVLRRGELVGLLTKENLGEFLLIQSALRKERA
ncbi:site-2 protease family protein [Candidatus Methylacidithermus pantelleriae]|uniref:Zinc metalloprotease n=1 Tax=Candidatus Methylacidithermus pantelleriae TaxID=2744239 RepID=A0A8J2FN91_9BACT|nr:site-2 protease family protein [Candidatus Methylacidithermus pantelleriae]CAF0689863.1 Zinc metalloprotease [Candidatus Methylacidithermus pantelleriae]